MALSYNKMTGTLRESGIFFRRLVQADEVAIRVFKY
jgi:hypothetical protein